MTLSDVCGAKDKKQTCWALVLFDKNEVEPGTSAAHFRNEKINDVDSAMGPSQSGGISGSPNLSPKMWSFRRRTTIVSILRSESGHS